MSWLKKQLKKAKNRITTKPWDRLKVNPMDRIMGDWTHNKPSGDRRDREALMRSQPGSIWNPNAPAQQPRSLANITGWNPNTGWGGGNFDWNKPVAGEGIQAIDPMYTSSYGNTRVGGTMSTPPSSLNGILMSPGYQDVTAQTTLDKGGNAFQWQDMNMDHVYNPGEEYDPRSSVWNGWMNQQDAAQNPTTPTTAGLGYVPQSQEQQNYQNAMTYADWSGDPLTAAERGTYEAAMTPPKHTWKTERAAGNDWLGDLF